MSADKKDSLTVVSRRDVVRRFGGLAAAFGVAAALPPGIDAPKAQPIPDELDAVAIDEERLHAAFRRMFAPGTIMTGELMATAMMMAVTGRIPDEKEPSPKAAQAIADPSTRAIQETNRTRNRVIKDSHDA